jgi:hypothetical protein
MIIDKAIETPTVVENRSYHKVLVMLGWNKPTYTVVKSVINGKGRELNTQDQKNNNGVISFQPKNNVEL